MGFFARRNQNSSSSEETKVEKALGPEHPDAAAMNPAGDRSCLPQRNQNGHLVFIALLCYINNYV
jgi:hypothetical protein